MDPSQATPVVLRALYVTSPAATDTTSRVSGTAVQEGGAPASTGCFSAPIERPLIVMSTWNGWLIEVEMAS